MHSNKLCFCICHICEILGMLVFDSTFVFDDIIMLVCWTLGAAIVGMRNRSMRMRHRSTVFINYGPTVAPRNHSPKGSPKSKQKNVENDQKQILILRAF